MQNWIANWLAGMVASKLNGYKTVICAFGGLLAVVVAVIGHAYPQYGLPGSTTDWSVLIGQARDNWPLIISGMGVAVGSAHKCYKIGVSTDAGKVQALADAHAAAVPTTIADVPMQPKAGA